ncbi:MAG: metallophosphoesterase [Puniceicoccaceae bacterium]
MASHRKIPFASFDKQIRELEILPGTIYHRFLSRLGKFGAQRRLFIEQGLYGETRNLSFLFLRRLRRFIHFFQSVVLRLAGKHAAGLKNASELHLEHRPITHQHLSPSRPPLQILHLSDFHLDLSPGVISRTIQLLESLEPDLILCTGDFFDKAASPSNLLLDAYAELLAAAPGTIYAVPGNHDTLAAIEALEQIGYRFLINESTSLQVAGYRLFLSGIEDPHLYCGEDFELLRPFPDPSEVDLWILLSHAPEAYQKAAKAGYHLMLCGHTHGGQICWKEGRPIIGNARVPKFLVTGLWHYQQLTGHTSRGVGSGQYPVRFNCPPEISLLSVGGPPASY